jgi:lysozyme
MSEQHVKQWQQALLGHGFEVGAVDGEFGPATLRASMKLLNGEPGGSNGSTRRKISEKGLAHIKASEGLRLKAYPDPASGGEPITIGYGHTGNIPLGLTITQAQADAYLLQDVARFEKAVRDLAPKTTQGQFDALVSFAFNVGEKALKDSTLLKMHNAGDYAGATGQFKRWTIAAGKQMPGLVKRRNEEATMYSEA